MIDGKMFGVISITSTQTCGICHVKPKVMNNLDLIMELPLDETLYDYWISTIHVWIKMVKERKEEIIKKIREKLCLLFDIPNQGYDGNTAPICFCKY